MTVKRLSTVSEVIQGDSSPKYQVNPSGGITAFDASWSGTLEVKKNLSDATALVSKAMVRLADGSCIYGYLLPAETASLAAGATYHIILQLESATADVDGPFVQEIQFKIRVYEQGVSA